MDQPRLAAEDERIARFEPDRPGRAAPRHLPDAEDGGVAKRQREDGRVEILLVAVLMQPMRAVAS